jgi:hypothetical protein
MNINAPTFVPLSDAKSPSSDHTQDIKHQGKSPVERQPPRKHHNKPHGHRGKGGNRSQHHQQRSSQRTDKAQKTAPIHRAVATNDGQTLSNVGSFRNWNSNYHKFPSNLFLFCILLQLTSIQSNKRGQVSLNHLLNFSFPERQAPQPVYAQRKVKSTPYQPYNKERFLNAK